jgi:putative ABC transport system permease protein
MFYSYRQFGGALPVSVVTLLVRTYADPVSLGPSIRIALREADDRLVPDAVMTMADRVMTSLARPRLYAMLLGGFAALALAIAAVGLYGVLSYTVAQRSRELAVRIAIGATGRDVVGLVTAHTLRLVLVGTILGTGLTFALTRVVRAMGGAGSVFDPRGLVFLTPILVVVAIGVLATWIPARRALKIDPSILLRST